jgi:hypothetical protein
VADDTSTDNKPWLKYQKAEAPKSSENAPWLKYQAKKTEPETKPADKKPSFTDNLKRAATAAGSIFPAGAMAVDAVKGVAGDIADAAVSHFKGQEAGNTVHSAIDNAIPQATPKPLADAVSTVTKPVSWLMELGPKHLEESGHPQAAKDLRAALDLLGGEEGILGKASLSGKAGEAIAKVTKAGKLTAEEAETANKASEATKAGYKVPQSMARSQPSKLEGFAGKKYTENVLSKDNQANTNKLVRKTFGLGDDVPLTRETMADVRKAAGNDYEALKNVKNPNMKITPELTKSLDDAAASYTGSIRGGRGTQIVKTVNDLKKSMKNGFTVDKALNEIKVLKNEEGKAYAAGDKDLARATTSARTAIEDAIERHLTNTKQDRILLSNFKKARTTYAKSFDVEKALDGAGNVDARKLAQQLKRGKPLSGELKTVARFGEGKTSTVAGVPKGETHPVSALDALALASGHGVAKAVAVGTGRQVARAVVKSRAKSALNASELADKRLRDAQRKLRKYGLLSAAGVGGEQFDDDERSGPSAADY